MSTNLPVHVESIAGRPRSYSHALADEIVDRLMEGESMRKICELDHMPSRATVLRWMAAVPEFEAKCARARVEQAELMDDMVLDEARAATPETANVAKVRIAAYQWRAAKLKPKKYGDKIDVTSDGRALPQSQTAVAILTNDPVEAARQYQKLMRGED